MSWISLARSHSTVRWAAGGWAFFIAENAILSENRTWLIEELGDDQYHLAYGTLSTIATASIGYAYYSIRKAALPPPLTLWKTVPPVPSAIGGWMFLSLGLVMASQVAPKMQIPVALVDDSNSNNNNDIVGPSVESSSTSSSSNSSNRKLQVQCPFDFTDKRDANQELYGLERISRHPGLWALGLVGLGQALLVPSIPQRIWWLGPAAVAWLGGSHTDYRYRRGMGGTLQPEYESLTSNIPFWAMLSGKQGSGCWQATGQEMKPWNAAVAVAMSSLWVLRKVR
jgi:hypothetical protein